MKKKQIKLQVTIDLEVSEELFNRISENDETLGSFILDNAFRNNARRVNFKGTDILQTEDGPVDITDADGRWARQWKLNIQEKEVVL